MFTQEQFNDWMAIKYDILASHANADLTRAAAAALQAESQAGEALVTAPAAAALHMANARQANVAAKLAPQELAARMAAAKHPQISPSPSLEESALKENVLRAQTRHAETQTGSLQEEQEPVDDALLNALQRAYAPRALSGGMSESGAATPFHLSPSDVAPKEKIPYGKGTSKVPGQGSGQVDSVPAVLAPGEAVLNKAAAEEVGRSKIAAANKKGAVKMGMVPESGKGGKKADVLHAAAGRFNVGTNAPADSVGMEGPYMYATRPSRELGSAGQRMQTLSDSSRLPADLKQNPRTGMWEPRPGSYSDLAGVSAEDSGSMMAGPHGTVVPYTGRGIGNSYQEEARAPTYNHDILYGAVNFFPGVRTRGNPLYDSAIDSHGKLTHSYAGTNVPYTGHGPNTYTPATSARPYETYRDSNNVPTYFHPGTGVPINPELIPEYHMRDREGVVGPTVSSPSPPTPSFTNVPINPELMPEYHMRSRSGAGPAVASSSPPTPSFLYPGPEPTSETNLPNVRAPGIRSRFDKPLPPPSLSPPSLPPPSLVPPPAPDIPAPVAASPPRQPVSSLLSEPTSGTILDALGIGQPFRFKPDPWAAMDARNKMPWAVPPVPPSNYAAGTENVPPVGGFGKLLQALTPPGQAGQPPADPWAVIDARNKARLAAPPIPALVPHYAAGTEDVNPWQSAVDSASRADQGGLVTGAASPMRYGATPPAGIAGTTPPPWATNLPIGRTMLGQPNKPPAVYPSGQTPLEPTYGGATPRIINRIPNQPPYARLGVPIPIPTIDRPGVPVPIPTNPALRWNQNPDRTRNYAAGTANVKPYSKRSGGGMLSSR